MQVNKYELLTTISKILDENERLRDTLRVKEPEGKIEEEENIARLVFVIGLRSMVEYYHPFNFPEITSNDSDELLTKEAFVAGTTADVNDYSYRQLPKEIVNNLSTKEVVRLFKPYIEDEYEKRVEEILTERVEKVDVVDGNTF